MKRKTSPGGKPPRSRSLAFRQKFAGSALLFYTSVASLIMRCR